MTSAPPSGLKVSDLVIIQPDATFNNGQECVLEDAAGNPLSMTHRLAEVLNPHPDSDGDIRIRLVDNTFEFYICVDSVQRMDLPAQFTPSTIEAFLKGDL